MGDVVPLCPVARREASFTCVDEKDTKGEEALKAFLTALGKVLK